MTRFDLRAVGWVVTYDTCADIASVAFGGSRGLTQGALRELSEQWNALDQAYQRDSPTLNGIFLASAPLPDRSAAALVAFVRHMAALCPNRYNADALRRRSRNSLARACVACALAIMLANGSIFDPAFGAAALGLLIIGLWLLLGTAQLWRTYRISRAIVPSRGAIT